MRATRPRRLIFRGRIEAHAAFFDVRLTGEREARRRIVAQWSAGATVSRVAGGYVLRLPAGRPIACERIGALPLSRHPGGALTSAPLSEREYASLDPPAGAMVLVRGGEARVYRTADDDVVDPAGWIDGSPFAVLAVDSLGEPPPPPIVTVRAIASSRRVFDVAVALPPGELGETLAALRAQAATPREPIGERASRGRKPFGLALLGMIGAMLARLSTLWARASAPPRKNRGRPNASNTLPRAPAPPPAGPSWIARFAERINAFVAKALETTRIGPALRMRHEEYVDNVIEMFRRGDLRDALRHAIPLRGDAQPGSGFDLAALLRTLGPRGALEITGAPTKKPAGVPFGPTLYDQLQELYRAAFQQLEREGRIEEAAFVLAELLAESEEAVGFLERHGRLRMAAEVAESRRLAPGLVVRQWFLAGERERAVIIARQWGAFQDAIVRLEKSDRAGADALRVDWARLLASGGDYAAAVEVVSRVVPLPQEARTWAELSSDSGGVAGARVLARMSSLWPDSFALVRARAAAMFAADAVDRTRERIAFVDALESIPTTPARDVLARMTTRALVRDAALTGSVELSALAAKTRVMSRDPVLRADLPTWPTFARVALRARTTVIESAIRASDSGTTRVFDAAMLPGGRMLLALGEAGVRMIARDGRSIVHLDEPAHRLVVSDQGERAIVVAERAGSQRLARVDLRARRATVWDEVRVTAMAPDFDGTSWLVGVGADFCMVDATAERFELLRKVVAMGDRIVAISRAPGTAGVLSATSDENAPESWCFDTAGWALRRRSTVQFPDAVFPLVSQAMAVSATGGWAVFDPQHSNEPTLDVGGEGERRARIAGTAATSSRAHAWTNTEWVAVAFPIAAGIRVCLFDRSTCTLRVSLVLGGASDVFARFCEGVLVLSDDRGRVLAADLESGSIVRDLRV